MTDHKAPRPLLLGDLHTKSLRLSGVLSAIAHLENADERGEAQCALIFLAEELGLELGSRLIDIQSQKRTVAASATAERNTFGHLSYRVAILRQSFSRPNMISIRLRRL